MPVYAKFTPQAVTRGLGILLLMRRRPSTKRGVNSAEAVSAFFIFAGRRGEADGGALEREQAPRAVPVQGFVVDLKDRIACFACCAAFGLGAIACSGQRCYLSHSRRALVLPRLRNRMPASSTNRDPRCRKPCRSSVSWWRLRFSPGSRPPPRGRRVTGT